MAEGTGRGEALSIWFFVGIMCLAYGVVLVTYGAWAWLGGHEAPTVLNTLHPTFWWGVLLTFLGTFYTLRFLPKRGDRNIA